MRVKNDGSEDGVFTYESVYGNKSKSFLLETAEREIGAPPKERRNINKLLPTDEATKTLKTAIEKAINSGEYQKFVTFHSQYMFDIHSLLVRINQRFLPWHRVYLLKFEEMLNNVMKRETGKDHNIALPYWDWEHDHKLPDFLNDLTPKMTVEVYSWTRDGNPATPPSQMVPLTVKRFPGVNARPLPTEIQVNDIRNEKSFKNFTILLENGPHGTVHNWVGGKNPHPDPTNPYDDSGEMAILEVAPLDFCFWCHHANLDRIWAEWQKNLEEEGNTSSIYPKLDLDGLHATNARMDPWNDITEPQTRKVESLGYMYR